VCRHSDIMTATSHIDSAHWIQTGSKVMTIIRVILSGFSTVANIVNVFAMQLSPS
jgi:hypothetical protein